MSPKAMLLSKTLLFYKRKDVQRKILEQAKDKEVAVRFKDYFGKRPDMLMYEDDILTLAKKKATSFHCSEELWRNPLQLGSEMKKQEMDELRKGWDLILDIDCGHFTYSKLAAHILVAILKDLGINSVTCKFSGNKGFHLAVPFEAFPQEINGTLTKELFPEAPKRVAFYLRDKLRPLLEKAIMTVEKNSISKIMEKTGKDFKDLVMNQDNKSSIETESGKDRLNVDSFLEIDTILIAPRHLYRMPYSFHEKSGLVSVPVDINEILKFKKNMAAPENVNLEIPFLDRKAAEKEEASRLFINAYDFHPKEIESKFEKKEYKLPEEAIPEEYFPPCIVNMLKGLEDGRKRAMFSLTNFFRGAGWSVDAIEQKLYEWNENNPEKLREVILKGQIHQLKKKKDAVPPHNCKRYYQDLQVCSPDSFCAKIKNPLQYSKVKYDIEKPKEKGARAKLTQEQKEMRRQHRERLKKLKQEKSVDF